MHVRSAPTVLLAALLLLGGVQAVSLQFYMTTEATTLNGGAEALSLAPGAAQGSHQFSPVLANILPPLGPAEFFWVYPEAFTEASTIQNDTTVDLYFDVGVEVVGETTVTLGTLDLAGVLTPLATATDAGTLQVQAHTESFTLATDGAAIANDTYLYLGVAFLPTVAGAVAPDVTVDLIYGDAAAPSGITGIDIVVVDTDGDGFGDTSEEQGGYDPTDPLDYPGAPPPWDLDEDGLDDAWEVLHFGTADNQTATGDPDGDGCTNLCEFTHMTDPNDPDTDGDTLLDGDEIAAGTDPLVADEVEDDDGFGSPEPWIATILLALTLTVAGIALFSRFT